MHTQTRRTSWCRLVARALCVCFIVLTACCTPLPDTPIAAESATPLPLPPPDTVGRITLEQALAQRRSVREYAAEPLSLADIAQLLWAAQGVTDDRGYRTAPSAGALYPLRVYVVVGNVTGLDSGIYRYLPDAHTLLRTGTSDVREELTRAALNQRSVTFGAACLVITGRYELTATRYGERAERYVHMEAGHAAQNVYLACAALELGTVAIGAFDETVRDVLALPNSETPLYLMPVGRLK